MAKEKTKKVAKSDSEDSSNQKDKKAGRKGKRTDSSGSSAEEKPSKRRKDEVKDEGSDDDESDGDDGDEDEEEDEVVQEKSREKGKEKNKEKEKDKSKDKKRGKPKEKDKDKDNNDKDKDKEKGRDKDKRREKEKEKDKTKDKENGKAHDRDKASSSPEHEGEPEHGVDDFIVFLNMNGKKGMGIEVDWANGTSLRVKDVKKEGAVPEWNEDHPPNQCIHPEDHVLAVNGKSGDPKAMLAECRGKKKLRLLVWAHNGRPTERPVEKPKPVLEDPKRRLADAEAALARSLAQVQKRSVAQPLEFMVILDMSRHTLLGVDADFSNGRTLFIKSIIPGAIEEWNTMCPAGRAVEAGAQIVAVNGYAGDAPGMAGLCKELCEAKTHLQLRLRGPPPAPPPQKDH